MVHLENNDALRHADLLVCMWSPQPDLDGPCGSLAEFVIFPRPKKKRSSMLQDCNSGKTEKT